MNSTPGAAVELLRPGSLLLRNPETIVNPFYHMAPRWALYPLVVMATMATIIASQAVISGAFSLTVQAIQRWHWPVASTLLLCGGFLIFDCAFLGANFTKISHGGWFPLLVALLVFATMSTWKQGRKVLAERLRVTAAPLTQFVEHIESFSPRKVPGTSVYMNGNPEGTPAALLHNLKHNKVLHERVVSLSVVTEGTPRVSLNDRFSVERLAKGIYRMEIHYGFMENPVIPRALKGFAVDDWTFYLDQTTFSSAGKVWSPPIKKACLPGGNTSSCSWPKTPEAPPHFSACRRIGWWSLVFRWRYKW